MPFPIPLQGEADLLPAAGQAVSSGLRRVSSCRDVPAAPKLSPLPEAAHIQ